MPKHVYWGFHCQTPNCQEFHIAKYIGIHDGRPIYFLPSEMPAWLEAGCIECGNIHRYKREQLETVSLDQPPPPEFVPWF